MQLLFAALALDALFSTPTLAGAHAGALVIDAQSGKTIYAHNAGDAFIPASTMKLIVGSVALERLGETFAYTTKISTNGATLIIEAGGDPLLSERDADQAAAAIAALSPPGLPHELRANTWRYNNFTRYPDGWQIDDLAYDYAAPVSALSFNENAIHIDIAASTDAEKRPTLSFTPNLTPPCVWESTVPSGPEPPGVKTTLDASGYLSYSLDTLCTLISGTLYQGQKTSLDAAVLMPEAFALEAFAQAFATHGMAVTVPKYPGYLINDTGRVLWTHESERLPDLLRDMWQPSDNLLAESLLDEIGITGIRDLRDTRGEGIAIESDWLKSIGVDPATLTIADGSGMSAYDRVTPRALVAILMHDWNSPARSTFLAALPVAGKSGTLEHEFKREPLAGNVIAKTGTSNHTRTLAGYLQTPHGTLVFALLVNDWMDSGPDAAARLHSFQEQFLERIRAGSAGV